MAFSGAWRRGTTYVSLTEPRSAGNPTAHSPDNESGRSPRVLAEVTTLTDAALPAEWPRGGARYRAPVGPQDRTDYQDREGVAGSGTRDRMAGRVESAAAAGVDLGAPDAYNYQPAQDKQSDARDTLEYNDLVPGQVISDLAPLRGLNALGVNNPEGYRPGRLRRLWHDRRIDFQHRGYGPPRPMAVAGTMARLGPNTPPVTEDRGYPRPAAGLAQAYRRRGQTPAARRSPRPWDDPVVADADTAPAAGLNTRWTL